MKLEIQLDMNRIDYDAINEQIREKIDAMNLSEDYTINLKIDCAVKEQVENKVRHYLCSGPWQTLNTESKREVDTEITRIIRDLVQPHITDIFNQIPQEEFDKMISEILPTVLVDLLTSQMSSMLIEYYNHAQQSTYQICEDRLRNIIK